MPLEIIETSMDLNTLRGNETIMIVEDSDSVRRLTVKIVSSLGYSVVTAKDGHEALSVLADANYNVDLIVSDVIMPKLSGPEFIHELARRGYALPHIYMTGFPRDKLTFREELQEDMIIIQKPYTREFLASRIREVLDQKSGKTKTLAKAKKG
jgi:CheY-like chemotaxis protein